MKTLLTASTLVAITLSSAAIAQTQQRPQMPPQASSNSGQNLAAAQQIQQDLKNAGFTDIKVVAESFVVQAKTKDGDPVVMTIGPHGMSVFEAMNASSGSSSTGSPSQPSTTGSGNPSRSSSPR